jgi:hypothetical protein
MYEKIIFYSEQNPPAISALGFYGNTDLTNTTDLRRFSFKIRR